MAVFFFFFNDTATTEIYTLSLHDALPILSWRAAATNGPRPASRARRAHGLPRSEEHTSELQSPCNLVCRLLLEKKKKLRTLCRTFLAAAGLQARDRIAACCPVSCVTTRRT